MPARAHTNVGASKTNPGTGATSPGEVMPASGTTPADHAAVQTARLTAEQLVTMPAPDLVVTAPKKGGGGLAARSRAIFLPVLVDLLRTYPDLAPAITADKVAEELAHGADLRQLATTLGGLVTQINGAAGNSHERVVVAARQIYAAAQVRAATDPAVATTIAPIVADLQRPVTPATLHKKATKTQAVSAAAAARRAATAQHRADLAKLHATLAEATAQAHTTGTVPTVTVTSPVPPTHP